MGWYWQPRHGSTDVLDATTIINPTTTNEIVPGFSRSHYCPANGFGSLTSLLVSESCAGVWFAAI